MALVGTALATFILSADAPVGPFSWAPLIATNEKRTMLIKIEAPNKPVDYGSGVVVGPLGYIFTAKHILGDDPIHADLAGLLDWKDPSVDFSKAIPLKPVYISKNLDFAVLKAAGGPHMPAGIALTKGLTPGQPVMLMGYPGGGSLMSTFGYVSGTAAEGTFASDVHAGGGNSGGPLISSENFLVGLLVAKNTRTDDGAIELSYAISARTILADIISHPGAGVLVSTGPTTTLSGRSPGPGSPPSSIAVAYGFDETKDDHPGLSSHQRAYRYVKQAQPGYLITSARIVIDHRNHVVAEPVADIIEGGTALSITFGLESGPMYDRWRGWIDGRVETIQREQKRGTEQ